MNKLIFVSIVALAMTRIACAENPCGTMYPQESGSWGVGFIWVSRNSSMSIYDRPNGERIGMFTREEDGSSVFEATSSRKAIEANQNDFVWAGRTSLKLFKVYKVDSKFLRVFSQTKGYEFWINLEENDKTIQFLTYRTLLLIPDQNVPAELTDIIRNANIGVNVLQTCLNLRKEGHVESEVLECLVSNTQNKTGHTHLKIIEINGDWANVEVTNYEFDEKRNEGGEGCSFRVVKKITGWVKLVDKNGHPNIWYSVTAY
jgi:hypothetical protein